jgi:hypothetical protein
MKKTEKEFRKWAFTRNANTTQRLRCYAAAWGLGFALRSLYLLNI